MTYRLRQTELHLISPHSNQELESPLGSGAPQPQADSSCRLSIHIRFWVARGDSGRTQGPKSVDSFSDQRGNGEKLACGDARQNSMMPDCSQAHAGNTATLRAVRSATKLTRRDQRFQVSRDGRRSFSEDAIGGRGRWMIKRFDYRLLHIDRRIERPQSK